MPEITDFNLDQRNGGWTAEYSDGTVKTGNVASAVAGDGNLVEAGIEMVPESLADDVLDVFVFQGSPTAAARNLVPSDGNGRGGDAAVVGAPVVGRAHGALSGGNYLQTQAQERYAYTIVCAMRIRDSGANKGCTWGDTYALDANLDGGVDAGSQKIGSYLTFLQTATTSRAGTLSCRVGVAKPDATTPVIGYMNPTLAVDDVSAWRLVALVVRGVSCKLVDLTAGTSSAAANAAAGYRRFPAVDNRFRIGADYSAYNVGTLDIAVWQHYQRGLTDAELSIVAESIRAYYLPRGIKL